MFWRRNIPTGYIYKYKLSEDIPFYHAQNITKHPYQNNYANKCVNKMACVHPQVTIRHKLKKIKGTLYEKQMYTTESANMGDLAIEITIPPKHFDKLEQIDVTEIDMSKLLRMYDLPFSNVSFLGYKG